MIKSREECLALLRNDIHSVEPGQKFVVDDFRPKDAMGVARLYYTEYGDGFPVDHVYHPEELVRLNAGPDLHQVIGRTEKGDIVGLYALFRNPPGKHIMEGGSLIVHPAYRHSSLAMRLAARIHTSPPERLKLDVMFGQTVCDHVTTQKIGLKYNGLYSALEIEAMPPRPGNDGRITLLDGFIVYRDRPHAVYLPPQYTEILQSIHANHHLRREYLDDPGPEKPTEALVEPMDHASLVRMTVNWAGSDMGDHLQRMEADFPGRHVYQIVLPLWRPGCTQTVATARSGGYFLGGLLPQWYDRDGLLLQKLADEPDYARIKLHPQEAKDLLEAIRADRNAVLSETNSLL